jgi:hypothetical protein
MATAHVDPLDELLELPLKTARTYDWALRSEQDYDQSAPGLASRERFRTRSASAVRPAAS